MIATGNHYNFTIAARSTTLLKNPPAASPSDTRKCSDFRVSTKRKPASFLAVSVQKSEHFWTLAGEAAQGFLKGTCLFGMSPLIAFFWSFSWRSKKRTLLHSQRKQHMFFAQNGRNKFVPNADFREGFFQIVDGTGKKHYTAFVRKRFQFGKL